MAHVDAGTSTNRCVPRENVLAGPTGTSVPLRGVYVTSRLNRNGRLLISTRCSFFSGSPSERNLKVKRRKDSVGLWGQSRSQAQRPGTGGWTDGFGRGVAHTHTSITLRNNMDPVFNLGHEHLVALTGIPHGQQAPHSKSIR